MLIINDHRGKVLTSIFLVVSLLVIVIRMRLFKSIHTIICNLANLQNKSEMNATMKIEN